MPTVRLLLEHELAGEVIASLASLLLFFAVRIVGVRIVRRGKWGSERLHLRWLVMTKQVSWLLLVLALIAIWGHELRELALSVLALGVAAVLATKELIQSALGSIQRASTNMFSIGDRIEVGGTRGDVIDHSVVGTTVLEVGPGHQRTGRAITLPNSLFLTLPVTNETYTESYVLHLIRIPLSATSDWRRAEALVLEAAEEVCGEFLEPASKHMETLARRHGLIPRSTAPRTIIEVPEEGRVDLLLRVPTPARDKGRVEQRILRAFLERWHGTPG